MCVATYIIWIHTHIHTYIYIYIYIFFIPLGQSLCDACLHDTFPKAALAEHVEKRDGVTHRKWLNSLRFTRNRTWWLVTGAMELDAVDSTSPIICSHDGTLVVHAVGIKRLG